MVVAVLCRACCQLACLLLVADVCLEDGCQLVVVHRLKHAVGTKVEIVVWLDVGNVYHRCGASDFL